MGVATTAAAATPHGASDASQRRQAEHAIPWQTLGPGDRELVHAVVDKATLFRRLPTRVIDCDPEMFALLVDRPELIVQTWRLMGVSRVGLEPIGPGAYRAHDAAGGSGRVRVLRQESPPGGPVRVLAYAEGEYRAAPMPTPITAKSVLSLTAVEHTAANGRTHLTANLDTFIRVDRRGVGLVAKTLRPLIHRTADHNFVETMRFVSLFSHTAERNPAGMARLAERLPAVDDAARRRLVEVSHRTAHRSAAKRDERLRLASVQEPEPTR